MRSRLTGAAVLLGVVVLAAGPALGQDGSASEAERYSQLDAYVKVFGAVLTGLGTLFGLPLALATFRKTRAEIRKLELESDALAGTAKLGGVASQEGGVYTITVRDSPEARIMVMADPRLLGPLLLLLDFILAWIVLTVAIFAVNLTGSFFLTNAGESAILGALALILLVPIWKEARRVRDSLKPAKVKNSSAAEGLRESKEP